MSIFEREERIKIPSELLSPNITRCIGDWIEMVANNKLTPSQLKERIKGLWWIASKSEALHSELLINNFESAIFDKTDEHIIDVCKTIFKESLNN